MNNRRKVLAGLSVAVAAPFVLRLRSASARAEPQLVKVADGLDHPWSVAFLNDGSMLVSERSGRLRHVQPDGSVSAPVAGIPKSIFVGGQGGLLGLALDPDFDINRTLFFAFSEKRDQGNCLSVGRATISDDFREFSGTRVIFRQNTVYPGGQHFGSRLVFDRDGHLFVTTGDRSGLRDQAQDPSRHVGKILRLTREGAPASGNPVLDGWAPDVWSIGHRNVQGACLHPDTGALWTAEHGARGGDEINTPQAGKNYGWPLISYGVDYSGAKIGTGTARDGLEQPLHYWDPSIAPGGMTFCTSDRYEGWRGDLFVCALAGQRISRLQTDGTTIVREQKLFEGTARFRDIAQSPDGFLYVITDESSPAGGIYRVEA